MDWLADFFELSGDAIDVNDDGLINVSDLSEGVTNLVDNAGYVINVQTLQQTIFHDETTQKENVVANRMLK